MTGVSQPTRSRLADALACVTDTGVDLWAPGDTYRADRFGVTALRAGRPDPLHVSWQITDPREAWEVLCTRLDLAGWVDDPRRRFAAPPDKVPCLACGGDGLGSSRGFDDEPAPCHCCGGSGTAWSNARTSPHPATVADCVALASDPAGVMTAEAIMRESARRERVVWRVVPAAAAFERVRRIDQGELVAFDYQRLAERRLRLGGEIPPHVREFADLLALGYALDAVTADAVVLVCPALDATPVADVQDTALPQNRRGRQTKRPARLDRP